MPKHWCFSAINAKELEIKFAAPVDEASVIVGGNLTNIRVTALPGAQSLGGGGAIPAELSEDGKTLTLTPARFFDGQYAITVPATVTDEDGNAIEAYSTVLSVDDTTRPTISEPTYPNNNTATFEFSEPINANDAAVEAVLTIKDADGVTVNDTGLVDVAADRKSFNLNIAGFNANETYTASLVGLRDFAGNAINPNPTTFTLINTEADQTDPEVTSMEAVNDSGILVKFSEPIDTTGDLFSLDIGSTADPSEAVQLADVTANDDNTEFTVDLALLGTAAFNNPAGLQRVEITGYNDLSGNTGDEYAKILNFVSDSEGPEVEATFVEDVAGTRSIVVEYNEDIALTAVNLNNVTFVFDIVEDTLVIDSTALSAIDKDGDGNNDSIAIDTEDYDNAGTVLPAGEYTITLPANLVADTNGNNSEAVDINVIVGDLVADEDTTAPNIINLGPIDNDTFAVRYSEDVTNATALNVANYTVEGQQVFERAIFDGDKQNVRLTLKDGIFDINGSRTLEIKNIKDASGNVMEDFTIVGPFVENVNPTLLSAQIVDTDKVLLTFSEGLDASTVATGDFTVEVNGNADAVTAATKANGNPLADGDTVVLLDLTTGIAALDDEVTVTLADSSVDDEAGNSNDGEVTKTATN